jgi:lipoprotein-releasing system ATP-binding protein
MNEPYAGSEQTGHVVAGGQASVVAPNGGIVCNQEVASTATNGSGSLAVAVPLVEVINLHKSFQFGGKTLPVLTRINLTIHPGEMLAIMGVSGAGKSTFLHILGGLDRPSSGKILFEGTDIFQYDEEALARFRNEKVGFVFQCHHLLPEFTALENVMMPGLIQRTKDREIAPYAKELLHRVGLSERIDHKPGKLSGGEQQRVAVAPALLLRPQLVLADEPTGNLDTQSSHSLFDLLKELNRQDGMTFVMVTHNEKLAAQMGRVVKIADGNVEAEEQ